VGGVPFFVGNLVGLLVGNLVGVARVGLNVGFLVGEGGLTTHWWPAAWRAVSWDEGAVGGSKPFVVAFSHTFRNSL